jgi:hypothetical protein
MPRLFDNWRSAWRSQDFRRQFLFSFLGLVVVLILHRLFQDYIEQRQGVVYGDPVLSLFQPVNLQWIAYSIIYSGTLLALVELSFHPFALLLLVRAFVVMIFLQMLTLSLLPLDPPRDAIVLADPFIAQSYFHPVITRELFFSWHTAVLTLFALTVQWRDLKILFAVAVVVMSVIQMLQHAHYTIDVVVAPCFAYAAYGLASWKTVVPVNTHFMPRS